MGGTRQRTLRAAATEWVRKTALFSVAVLLVLSLAGNTYAVGTQPTSPKISLTKSASDVTHNGDGTFDVEFVLGAQG